MVSIEMALDSALSPTDQSCFNDDYQTQHFSDIRPQTPLLDDYWIQDFEDIRSYYESLELSPINEPEVTLEAMTKGADTQCQTKSVDVLDYLDSTAFLSPVSNEPQSPQTVGNDFDKDLDLLSDKWNNTTGMAILEEILSANSSDSEVSEECFDSDLNVQYFTETEIEASNEPKMIESTANETNERPKRRQLKRKINETETQSQKPKTNKRNKSSVSEKKERKRSQNKSAANRYRIKKRAELDSIEGLEKNCLDTNQRLKAELQKLQMEFKVVYPLAKAAFASDYSKSLQLQTLDLRVLRDNLLE